MTRKLEELFELPENSNTESEEFKEGIRALEEIDQQIPNTDITDLSSSDKEMDDLANKAMDHYDSLMDLGLNVEPRFSAPIFEAATKLMGHAITAKTNKIDKKLKALDLDLKKRRLELQEKQANINVDDSNDGVARELDRNALLEMLRNNNNNNQ